MLNPRAFADPREVERAAFAIGYRLQTMLQQDAEPQKVANYLHHEGWLSQPRDAQLYVQELKRQDVEQRQEMQRAARIQTAAKFPFTLLVIVVLAWLFHVGVVTVSFVSLQVALFVAMAAARVVRKVLRLLSRDEAIPAEQPLPERQPDNLETVTGDVLFDRRVLESRSAFGSGLRPM